MKKTIAMILAAFAFATTAMAGTLNVFAEYIGRQKGFECCICGKGCNAFTFNILHGNTIEDAIKNYREHMDYETWGFGPTHIKDAVKLDSLN